MVASVIECKSCSGPEAYFCRLIAFEGYRPSRAYTVAWKTKTENAAMLAARVLLRPHVEAKLAELRAAADREGAMAMAERRRLLAETARSVSKREKASHSDRIAAIREDAILAGERRTDGTQVNVGIVVDLGSLLGSIGTPLVRAQESTQSAAGAIVDVPAPVVRENAPESPKSAPVPPPASPLDTLGLPPGAQWLDD